MKTTTAYHSFNAARCFKVPLLTALIVAVLAMTQFSLSERSLCEARHN